MSPLQFSLLFVLITAARAAVKLPPYLKTCSRNDPKINECALKSGRELIPIITKGDRSIRLPPLDPLVLDRLEVKPSGNSRTAGLALVCRKCNIVGLGQGRLDSINIDIKNNHIDLDLSIPHLIITGKYEVSGRVLILPITGKGDANITIPDLKVKMGLDWKLLKKKGDEYAQITKYKVNFTTGRLWLMLTNLFNGDKALSDSMNNFLNDNWQEVMKDMRPAVSETIGETTKLIINNIFDLLPYNLVYPEK